MSQTAINVVNEPVNPTPPYVAPLHQRFRDEVNAIRANAQRLLNLLQGDKFPDIYLSHLGNRLNSIASDFHTIMPTVFEMVVTDTFTRENLSRVVISIIDNATLLVNLHRELSAERQEETLAAIKDKRVDRIYELMQNVSLRCW